MWLACAFIEVVCIADNVFELYRSLICDALFDRSSGLGVNGIKLLGFRCAFISEYVKFGVDVVPLDTADDIDDSTVGSECVPFNCCEDVENAVL